MNPPPHATLRPTRIRFIVLAFACTLSLLTYLDRVCISRVSEDMCKDLGMSDIEMGWVFSAFLLGYCLFEVPGGWMGDNWGARRVIMRIVIWWSLFTALTGYIDYLLHWTLGPALLTPSIIFAGMLAVRFLFGCGEAGAYPNLARVVSNWFPYRERALAQGSIWMSARLGGAIAPIFIGRLTVVMGWRNAFLVLGGIGILWAVVFYRWYRNRPEEVPACNEAERELIHSGKPPLDHDLHGCAPWKKLFLNFQMLAIGVVAFMVSYGWYFYPTWLPKYLKDVHAFEYKDSEWLTALPFLCGAAGSLIGGGLSDRLVRWTGSKRWGRSLIGCAGFVGAGICVYLTGFATEWQTAVTLLCLAFFINDLAIPPIWAVCSDIGGKFAGTVAGIMNMIGAFGGMLSPLVISYVVTGLNASGMAQVDSWMWVFILQSSAWFIGAVAWLYIDAGKPIVQEPTAPTTEAYPAGHATAQPHAEGSMRTDAGSKHAADRSAPQTDGEPAA